MRPPWRLQALGDELLGRYSGLNVSEQMPDGPEYRVQLDKKYDGGWWVILEGPTTQPQVIFWPMRLHERVN